MKKITKFQKRVYKLCKKVPKGKVTTYKAIAQKMKTKAYRAIGMALNKNPYGAWGRVGGKICRRQSCLVPCHRVVGSNGNLVGFASGLKKKAELLKKEGIRIKNNRIVDFDNVLVDL
jgi:methylated-DNA-[protein]-cysteine S-methyltransferase